MKAEELMIGDWVQLFPDKCRVDGIICLREEHTAKEKWMAIVHLGGNKYKQVNVNILEPIPLTPEILEKNFGRPYGVGWYDAYELKRIEGEGIYYVRDAYRYPSKERFSIIKADNEEITFCSLKFVHKLQNALKLCEIEKEIVL